MKENAALTAANSPYTVNITLSQIYEITAVANATTATIGNSNKGPIVIPVTIIVEPAETTTNNFALVYDANGGSGTTNSTTGSSAGTSTSLKAAANGFTRAGYTFAGWNTQADGKGTPVAAGANVTVSTSDENKSGVYTKTLYAQWTQDTFSVEYHYDGTTPSGATPPTKETDIAAAATGNHTLAQPTAVTGWTFNGWKLGDDSAAGSGNVITEVSKAQADGTKLHVWGTWTQNEYTLTWDGNDGAWGTDTTKTETKHYGDSISAYGTDPTRTYYKFLGWSATESGAVINFTTSPQTMPAAAKTYYAQWVGQSTVKFNLAGGTASSTGSVDERTGDVGTDIPDKPGNPTKTGYTFGGWSDGTTTVTDASGIKFPANAGDVVTYTAQWTEQPGSAAITVNKDGSGWTGRTVELKPATGSNISSTSNSGGTYNFTNVPSKNYTVIVNSVDTGVTVDVPKGGSVTGTVDFYTAEVKGVHGSATVTGTENKTVDDVSATAASGATASIVALKGTAVTWTKGTADAHYHWGHWDSTTTDTTSPKSLTSIAAKTSHTATFEADTYTVTFDPNSGTVSPTSATVTYPNKVTSLPTPTRSNFTFANWWTANGQDTTQNWGSQFTTSTDVTADVTVYAKWTYNITYNVNWGSNVGTAPSTPTAVTGKVAGSTQEKAPTLTATYYTFGGWNTAADGSGTDVGAGADVPEGTKTLYAKWTQKKAKITVQFSLDGTADTWPTGYTTINVTGPDGNPWGATSSDKTKVYTLNQGVNYTVTDGHYSQTITALAADTTVTIPYYTMTATTLGHGTVKVASGTLNDTTTSAANNSVSIVVPYHASVTWTATPNTNYTVTKWNNAADTATTKSESNVTAAVTKTVEFSKNKFNTYLKLNVNGQPWGTKDVSGTTDKNIKNVQLVTANNGNTNVSGVTVSYDGTEKVWAATGITSNSTNAQPYWRVTTVDGGVYYTKASVADKTADAEIDDATATENLFGIVIEDGAGNGTGNKPTLKAQTGSTARNRIVTRRANQNTVALNAKAGYTYADWAMLKGLAPAVTNIAPVDASDGTATTYTLGSGYTALPTAPTDGDLDLHIMPLYTYSVTVRTVRGTTPTAPGGTVVVNGNTISGSNGVYTVTGLTPGATTYPITVNGFESSVSIAETNANKTVDVTLYSVTMAKQTAVGSETIDGKAFIGFGSTAPTSGNSVYLPVGAKTDATHVVTVAAATGAKYRLKTGTGEHPWTAATYVASQDATTTTLKTPDAGMAADITITADFVRQYDATVSVDPSTGGTATFTGKDSNTGTVINSGDTTAMVDNGSWVRAKYVPSTGSTLKSWTFTNGTLWTDPNKMSTSQLTSGAATTATTVYFFPTADGATLRADTEAALYDVEIAVNLDNGAYKDSGSNTVQVKIKDGTKEYDLTKKSGSDGVYTVKALPGNYDIYVNGLDISKTVAATAAFDTAKNLNFSANDAEGKDADGNALTDPALATAKAKLKQEINYYTVKLAVSPANASPVNNQVAFASSVANVPSTATGTASTIVLATGSTQSIHIAAKAYDDGAATHYRFKDWAITHDHGGSLSATNNAAPTYTLPNETTLKAKTSGNFNITSDKQITLTASFVQQYKVTVKGGYNADAAVTPQVMVTGGAGADPWKATVYVDKGGTVDLHTKGSTAGLHFQSWTIAKKADNTTDDGAGKFLALTGTAYDAAMGLRKASADNATNPNNLNGFQPEADTVIDLNLWKEPDLTDGLWTYERANGTNPAGVKQFTWTANDAKAITNIAINGINSTTYAKVTLDSGDYSLSGNKIVLQDSYINSLAQGDYAITVTYTLGTTYNEVANLTKTTNFYIKVTPYTLTRVDIGVPTKTAAEDYTRVPNKDLHMKVDATDSKTNMAAYLESDNSHLAKQISKDDLTFTWYWAATAPTQGAMTGSAPSSWNEITNTSDFTATFTKSGDNYTAVPTFTANAANYAALKGNYVFAVVTATTTGQGSVITNAIPVDYDATITVKKDTAAITADYGHYRVYLVPTTLTNPNFGGNLATQGIVEATHVAGTDAAGVFSTKNSGLVGETNYYVYVNDAEDAATANHHYVKADNTAITPLAHTKDVNYYSVNRVGFTQKHFEDSANAEVGEDFSTGTYAINSVTTGNSSTVANGNGVLSGVSVTAKANTWSQDYTLTWQKDVTTADGSALTNTTTVQNSATANGTGYANGAVTAKTFISGRLNQNTYTISGDIKGNGGQVNTATLTFGGYTFNGTVGNSGAPTGIVSFTVPKSGVAAGAITGSYTITATPKTTPATTIQGYSVPSKSALDQTAPMQLQQVTASGDNKFTIFIATTTKTLRVEDNHTTPHNAEASDTGTNTATHTDKGTFANYTFNGKTVTVTNKGNTPLTITLTITKGAAGTGTTVYDGTQSLGTGDTLTDGQVTFADLQHTFDLDPAATETFGVTVGGDLNATDDTIYRMAFTSVDAREGVTANGPTVNYDLALVVDPVTIKKVEADKQSDGSYKATAFEINETNGKNKLTVATKTNNGDAPSSTGDLVYTWYVAAWNDAVTLDKTTGEPKLGGVTLPLGTGTISDNGRTYNPTAADKGKALYLVLKGQNNATSAAMTPNPEEHDPVVLVPYAAGIKIIENTNQVTDATEAGKYTVELRRKGAPAGTAAIATTWDTIDHVFKTDEVLWASDPANPDPDEAWVYEVWANTVKGNNTLQNTGKTIAVGTPNWTEEVVYYQVNIDNTTVHQNDYQGTLTPTDSNSVFYHAAPHNPTAKAGTINVADAGWVQKDTVVTFTYGQWDKDYDLAWSGGLTASDTAAQGNAGDRSHTATYSSQLNDVATQLKLNLYNVAAHVTGTVGWVNKITMAVDGYTFTTKDGDGSNILGIGTAEATPNNRIAVGKTVTFRLPKATFNTVPDVTAGTTETVKEWGYSYNGTTSPMNANAKTFNVTVSGTDDEYTVILQGDGLNMTVAETDLPAGMTNGAAKRSGQGSIPDGETSTPTNGTINQTIHLNYNYPAGQTVKVQVANSNTVDRDIYNVKWTEGTKNNISRAGTFAGGKMGRGDTESVTLNIADGRAVGTTINYTATITFDNGKTDADKKSATVTYKLTVVVDPLPFTKVTTATDGSTNAKDYTVTPTGGAAITTSTDDTNEATLTGLVHNTDYAYKWVRTAMDVTLTNADVTWAAGAVTLPATAHDCTGTGAATPNYTPNAADQGQKLYLVVYAKNGKNASEAAISAPITQGYNGIVYINVDTAQVNTAADPGYTVQFISGSETVTGAWQEVTTGNYAYVGSLTPGKDYTVKVSRFAGDATHLIDLAKTLNGTAIGTATTKSNVTEANYFSVTAKDFNPKHYLAAAGETFADADKRFAMTVGTGSNATALTSGTYVLSGQDVTAKANGWTQDYLLTWQSDSVTGTVSVDAATADKGTAQNSTTAHGTGYTQTITAKTFIGGRLDQKTYTVTGSIKNPTGKTGGEVSKVEMAFKATAPDTRAFTLTATDASTGDHKFADGNADGHYNTPGDTVTFKVVKGEYNITAYEGANTTITRVTIGGAGDSGQSTEKDADTTRNKETLTPAVVNDSRIFTIYLEGRDLRLTVADGHTTPHTASSIMTDNNKHADHPQTYYFNSISGSTALTLSNPGNADLAVNAHVFRFGKMADVPDFATGTWNSGTALVSGTDYKHDASGSVITISTPLAANAALAQGATNVNAGSITVTATAKNADDGVYVVRFTSTTTDTDGNPHDGPTVYYVFDLTVNPLPIVGVDAVKDATTGVMSLEDYDGTDGGRNHVWVDHDGNSGTAAVAANAHGIVDGDLSFAWARADVGVTVDASKFQVSGTTLSPAAGVTDVTIIPSASGKTYTPVAADSGKNIYLIVYRKDVTSNASELAVSTALFANVAVTLEAYRTGTTTDAPGVAITGTYAGTDTKSSDSPNTITTKNTGDKIAFVADEADNATPASAKYYFKEWSPATMTAGADRYHKTLTVTAPTTVIGYYDLLPTLAYKNGALAGGYVIGNDSDEVIGDRTLKYTHNDGSGTNHVEIWIAPADATSDFNSTWAGTGSQQLTFGYFDKVNGATGSSIVMGVDGEYILSRNQLIKPYLKPNNTYVITFYDMVKGAKAGGYAGYDRSVTLKITAGNFDVTARARDVDGDSSNGNQGGNVRLYTGTPGAFAKTDVKPTSGGFIQAEAKPEDGYRFVKWVVLTHDDDPAVSNVGAMTPADGKSAVVSFSPDGEGAIIEAIFEKAEFTTPASAKAEVYYGDNKLNGGDLEVSITKDATAGVTQTFDYDLADATELGTILGGTIPSNVYAKSQVMWLNVAADGSDNAKAVLSVTAAATGVNVKKTGTADATDELVVYLKVTETHTGEAKYVPVTIDVMTSKLKIHTANTADSTTQTTAEETAEGGAYSTLYTAAAPVGEGKTPDDGDKVLYEYFNYTNVQNYYNGTEYVDGNNTGNGHAANAAGANRWQTGAGADNSQYGVVTNGYWTVAPAVFSGAGDNEYVEGGTVTNPNNYVFTFHYTGDTTTDADNYNYEATTDITLSIEALAPAVGLKFADVMSASNSPAATPFDVKPGAYSDHSGAAETTSGAPLTLNYAATAKRDGEHITYLDNEPRYTVTIKKVGELYDVKLVEDPGALGFAVDGTLAGTPTFNADGEYTFRVKLTALNPATRLWAGDHKISFTATGNTKADGTGSTVTATYTLALTVDAKVITDLEVVSSGSPSATGTTEGSLTPNNVNNMTADTKGNIPLKPVEKTSTTGPDGRTVEEVIKVPIDPNYQYKKDATPGNDIKTHTKLDAETPTGNPNIVVTTEDNTDGSYAKVVITRKTPWLMHDDVKDGTSTDTTGPRVNDTRTVTVAPGTTAADLGKYQINLGAYGADVHDVKWTIEGETDSTGASNMTTLLNNGATLTTLPAGTFNLTKDTKRTVTLNLTGFTGELTAGKRYSLSLKAAGKANATDTEDNVISTYVFTLQVSTPSSPGGPVEPTCPCKVFYHVGIHGITDDPTVEDVSENGTPAAPPTVTALEGYVFKGWSLTNPANLKEGEKAELVDPKTVKVKGEIMIFYAVIQQPASAFHQHYVIGYPNGMFGPTDDINRASVATIIARAILPDFVEGSDYGNPGGYSDVEGHWAESAIAYCSMYGVFEGMPDGTFQPDRPITRQELAVAVARLDGILEAGEMSFTDIDDAGDWALGGIYTAFTKGWVDGYTDGSFKPLNNIRRDEAVKLFNAYLNRGVDAEGLSDLHEYVHSGAASNNTGNGENEYMTWPDVPVGQWAYYEIIEAANDHQYRVDDDGNYTVPEHWEKCWIDERWRYSDDATSATANAGAAVSAGFRVWFD